MIQKIIINKFRTIDQIELNIKPLTILVGKNNSGKSNILDAIKAALDEETQFEKNTDCFSYKKEHENNFNVEIVINEENSLNIPKGKSKKDKTIQLENFEFLYISAEFDIKDPCASKEAKSELIKIFELAAEDVEGAESRIQGELDNILKNENIKNVLIEMNQYLEKWDKVGIELSPQKPAFKKIIDYYSMNINETGKNVNAETLGSGLKRAIIASILHAYAKVQAQNKNGNKLFLLFEEPELFLHPWQLKQLRQDLVELSSNGHIIIATTHSPQFASPKSFEEWDSIIKISKEDGLTKTNKLNAITKSSFDNQQSKEINPIKYLLMLDKERAEIFFSDKIIIVEGWTEKAILEKLIQEGKITGNNFYIFETLGKYNIYNMVMILKELNLKFLIIYDTDKDSDEYNRKIENLNHESFITVFKVDNDIETFLIKSEHLTTFKKKTKGRRDLKPALLLDFYENEKLITKNLAIIQEKCNNFLSD